MKLVVGLGNPGREYENTRHNVGWLVVDALAKLGAGEWSHSDKFEAEVAKVDPATWKVHEPSRLERAKFILLKPTTFMNNSGRSVERVRAFYKLEPSEIVVIHDELALPLGTVRIRLGGQTAGHNGIGSLIHHLGTDQFWRVRIGIETDHPQRVTDPTGYVLDRFSSPEREPIDRVIDQTVSSLVDSLSCGSIHEESFTVQ